MGVNLDFEFDLNCKEIEQFLLDVNEYEFEQKAEVSDGFKIYDPDDKDKRSGDQKFDLYKDIPYIATVKYAIEQAIGHNRRISCELVDVAKQRVGIAKLAEPRVQNCRINCNYYLALHVQDINESLKNEARRLFKEYVYDPKVSLTDWIKKEKSDDLLNTMYEIIPVLTLEKIRDFTADNSQYRKMKNLYCEKTREENILIDEYFDGDNRIEKRVSYYQWANDLRYGIRDMELPAIPYDGESNQENVREVNDPQNDPVIPEEEKKLLDKLIDTDCKSMPGVISHHNKRILDLFSWPEFKIAWKWITIKIGCSKIRLKIPVLQTRTANISLYATYVVKIEDANLTIRTALERCALKSALLGGVVGVALGNLTAATATFKAAFKLCIKDFMKSCFIPDLQLLKTSSGGWS